MKNESSMYKKRKSRVHWYLFFGLPVLAFVFAFIYYLVGIHLPSSSDESQKTFSVSSGQSSTNISRNLQEQGFIKSAKMFEFYAWLTSQDDRLQVGVHELSSSMNVKEILAKLSEVHKRKENQFTIIEGWKNADIVNKLSEKGIIDFEIFEVQTTKKQAWWDSYDFLQQKPRNVDLEGYLFPDTYRVFEDASETDILKKMLNNFDAKLTDEMQKDIKKQGKTIHNIITLASILEMEVQTPEDKKIVAGLFYTRLNIGMALQADSTVNYVTGKNSPGVSLEDLKVDSPYNTYKNRGLPPGPINNPGLASIIAAVYPEDSDYLYFLTTPEGEVIYSEDFDSHVEAKLKYLK